jgi:hypothetical protein
MNIITYSRDNNVEMDGGESERREEDRANDIPLFEVICFVQESKFVGTNDPVIPFNYSAERTKELRDQFEFLAISVTASHFMPFRKLIIQAFSARLAVFEVKIIQSISDMYFYGAYSIPRVTEINKSLNELFLTRMSQTQSFLRRNNVAQVNRLTLIGFFY